MKKYKLIYSKGALKALGKMDKYTKTILVNWIEKNLVDCEDPYFQGKELKGKYKGLWRYRVGDYRILSEIHDDKLVILLVKIAHRREAYKK